MSQTPQTPSLEPPDPLASLHKMSTTAGLGSTDYVAVNPTAVFALIVGLVSAVTLFNEPLLLVIPLVGVVGGIIALRQVARSNGTQTGRALAIAAIALCIGFGGIVGARKGLQWSHQSHDKAAIGALVRDFSQQLKAEKYDALYALFDDRFKQRISFAKFQDQMKFLQRPELHVEYGELKGVTPPDMPLDAPTGYRWGGLAEFVQDPDTGTTMATAQIILHFEKGDVWWQAWWRKVDEKWLFEDIPSLFPRERNPGQPGGPQ